MRAFALRRGDKHGALAGTILCHDIRGVFRKGHALREEDIPLLIDAAWDEIHLLELAPDDIAQREAGQRLAQILSSDDVQIAPAGHRHILKAKHNGLFKVDVAALQRLNGIPGIAVFTLMNDSVVSAGEVVAEAQITPLAIERSALEQVSAGIVRVLPFEPRDVFVFSRDDRDGTALTAKLESFGCRVEVCSGTLQSSGVLKRTRSLIIVSGSNALDPLDPTFVELQQLDARLQRIGMPVHPGTLLWIATVNSATIIGLPSCGLGTGITAFDLVLPRLLAEGRIAEDELAALGHGGMLRHRKGPVLGSRSSVLEHEPVR